MLNKKDPLIGAVQEVMKRNQIEREATRLVNEAFGIEDRKALPHEYQAEWDSAYKSVLTEGVEALDEGDDPLQDKADYLNSPWGRDRKPGIKDKRRKKKDREAYGKAANTWWSVKKNKLNPKRLPEEALDEKSLAALAPPHDKVTHKDVLVGRGVLKQHPTQPGKHVLAKEEEQLDERAAGGMVDYMQKKARRDAAMKASQNKGSDPTNAPGGIRAGAPAPRGSDPTNTPSGQRAGAAPIVKPKVKPQAAAPKAAAPKAAAPAAPQPKKKLTNFQKMSLRSSEKNDTMDQTRRMKKRYGVMEQIQNIIAEKAMGGMVAQKQAQQNQPKRPGSPMPVSGVNNTSWFSGKTDMQRATQDMGKMDKLRRMQKNPPALAPNRDVKLDQPATKSPMAIAQNRQDLAKSVQAGRAGTNTALNRAPASSGVSGNPMGDVNPGQEYSTPTSPQSQAQSNMTPTVKTRPDLPVARKKAEPIKVSDTEVMNDPKFKKAVSSVGGTQAAKKIQTGERVAGLGRFNKGDTIMSRVRTDIAARKNVGRES